MTMYKLEDLKVGAVFKNRFTTRTILMVGKSDVFYSYQSTFGHVENICPIDEFLRGEKGDLVKPTTKITYVEYWNCHDLSSKKICSKEIWVNMTRLKTNKFIREIEIEVGEDGFPIDGAL